MGQGSYIRKSGINYPIVMGDDVITKSYKADVLPATYLIDKSGKIAASYTGVLIDKNAVEANIKRLLAE